MPDPVLFKNEVKVAINIGGRPFDLSFVATERLPETMGLATYPALMVPRLMVDDTFPADMIEPNFLEGLKQAEIILNAWGMGEKTNILQHLKPGPSPAPKTPTGRVATFFTGGVDSFHTLLKEKDEITDLIYVEGFDIRPDQVELMNATLETVDAVAKAMGKNVIRVRTNLKDLLDQYKGWSMAHGTALIAIGHLLAEHIDRVLIPSSFGYADLQPSGSHPLLDPLFNSSQVDFIHHGLEDTRPEKITFVGQSDLAMQYLRVCWMNYEDQYNCGRCEKCLRTMIALRAHGQLTRCQTLPHEIPYAYVQAMEVPDHVIRTFIEQNLAVLRANGGDKRLERAMEASLKPRTWWRSALFALQKAIARPERIRPALKRRLATRRTPTGAAKAQS